MFDNLSYQKHNGVVRVVEVLDTEPAGDGTVAVEVVPTTGPVAPRAVIPVIDNDSERVRERVPVDTISGSVNDAVDAINARQHDTPTITVSGKTYLECEVPKSVIASLPDEFSGSVEFTCCQRRQNAQNAAITIERNKLDFMPLFRTVVTTAVAICQECKSEVDIQLCG